MENTTLTGTAPLTRRQAREIERRTGVRPVAGLVPSVAAKDTGEIERNEMDALVSVLPTELVERVAAPLAAEEALIPAAFDARGLSVRAARPAVLVAQRRRRVAGGFAAAASVTAVAAAALTTVSGQAATVAADEHQANLLSAATKDATEIPEETEESAEVATAAPIEVDAASTSTHSFDATLVQAAATEVVVETSAEDSEAESGSSESNSGGDTGSSNESSSSNGGGSSTASTSYSEPGQTSGSIVDIAYGAVGTGIYGNGNTPSGWDCSGFTQWVFAQSGVSIPRSVSGQHAFGTVVSNPQPGDLVIWPGQHVGIYVGDGMMIDSPSWGRSIELDKVAYGPSPSGYIYVRI